MDNLSRFFGEDEFNEISFSESVMFLEFRENFTDLKVIDFEKILDLLLKKVEEKKKKGKYETEDEEEETYESVFSHDKKSRERVKEKYAEEKKEEKRTERTEYREKRDDYVVKELEEKKTEKDYFKLKHIEDNFANIEYIEPIEFGNHKVYQQIFFEGDRKHEGKTVYELLENLKNEKGLDVKVTDKVFNGKKVKYIESIDGKRENLLAGEEVVYKNDTNMYWEVLVNGEFADKPIDQIKLKEGDVVEFRLKTETDETACGSGPDEYSIVSMVRNGFVDKSKLPSYMQTLVRNDFYDGFSFSYQGEKSGKGTLYHIMPVFGVG